MPPTAAVDASLAVVAEQSFTLLGAVHPLDLRRHPILFFGILVGGHGGATRGVGRACHVWLLCALGRSGPPAGI